ncbi:topoisomerase (DNA) II binding protein 1 [Trypanosoma rangeli]|uniref:Topoisomerase (DNA) II binding protein 1 n=1 Tax=Trypanosoma rangeli TaxID=5698 RepID=A0A422NNI8_TRYRA|nr:topoisomerase (DNA) II binding protein 1 [Trypanosoma rangeli]RNF06986.1 topoisomerase (DNA) II binding protein 1 [Trypanosoma rangeli]|eukprot:RNF06986.1 topoisomerase (DNA) II binding protein 1 [Trypanosoma rangeli]
MLVTTTVIYGRELERIKTALYQCGVAYVADLTTATNVLIAGRGDGDKYRVARKRGIPCVTSAWVWLGRCDENRVSEFEIGRSLLGLELCSTSLSKEERGFVRRMCATHQATYTAYLTRNCAVLVVPNGTSDVDGNEKLCFAIKNRIEVVSYDGFKERYGSAVGLHRSLLPVARQPSFGGGGALGIVVYCSPTFLMTDRISTLLNEVGVRHAPVLTPRTTHVLVLGQTEEVFSPRPNLEFVSVAWLEECAARRKHVAVAPYRVSILQRPIITFTGVPQEERMSISSRLEQKGLPCLVQGNFVLSGMTDDTSGERNTTHLVLGRSPLLRSSKVAALSFQRYALQRKECFLVYVGWLHRSLEVGRWVDPAPFSLVVPHISAFGGIRTRLRATSVAAPSAETNNDVVDSSTGGRRALSPCSSSTEIQDEPLSSHSLALFIEGLETKTSDRGRAPTTPPTVAPEPALPTKLLLQERAEGHSGAGACLLTSTASLCVDGNHTSLPTESQVIVYKRSEFDLPRKVMRQQQQQQQQQPCVLLRRYRTADAERASAIKGTVYVSGVASRGSSGRLCCIMLAKSLTHMEGNLERLQALGCTLATTLEECTHYVTGKPSRTEFFLSTVAAGKWVLAPSFLEEALREGRIVSEEAHEWCPEIARAALLRSSVVELVRACRLQRKRTVRSFASWRVALCCTKESRTESLSHVLRSGGCCVVRPYSPFQLLNALESNAEAVRELNLVLSGDDVWEPSQLDTVTTHLPVYKLEYIAHCLCVEVPEPELYRLQSDNGHVCKRLKVA